MSQNDDPKPGDEQDTAYESQERPVTRKGRVSSLWGLTLAAVFLISIVGWLLLRPYSPEPAIHVPLTGEGATQ